VKRSLAASVLARKNTREKREFNKKLGGHMGRAREVSTVSMPVGSAEWQDLKGPRQEIAIKVRSQSCRRELIGAVAWWEWSCENKDLSLFPPSTGINPCQYLWLALPARYSSPQGSPQAQNGAKGKIGV
jgi:hypothetical protein